jgi:hypothetical protein
MSVFFAGMSPECVSGKRLKVFVFPVLAVNSGENDGLLIVVDGIVKQNYKNIYYKTNLDSKKTKNPA